MSATQLSPQQHADRILAAQHGVISRAQVLACGLSDNQIHRRLRSGQWRKVRAGVYRSAVVEDGRNARSTAMLLAAPAGAAFSHYSAARLHGLDIRPGSALVWLTIPHGSKRVHVEGARLIRSRNLANFTTTAGGHPATTVARTLADLGPFVSTSQLKWATYDALRERKTTTAQLHKAWAAVRKGSRSSNFQQLLEELEEGFDSGLEALAGRIFRDHGLHLVRQYRVRVQGRIIRRFDFCEPVLKVGIEIDGMAYHSSAAAQERDRKKDRVLASLGWQTLRFTTDDVRRRPQEMVATIRRVLAQRAGETAPA